MKLLTRDSSSYLFMTLGGLFSKKDLPEIENKIIPESFSEKKFRANLNSFSVDEKYVESYLIKMLKDELGWSKVQKKHDIWAFSGQDKIFIECKKYTPKYLYLEDHKGGKRGENAQEQVRRYFNDYPDFKWGILTDGVTFRLYYNSEDPTFEELFLEISLQDILDSTQKNPYELQLLIDMLSPDSKLRSVNPEERHGLSKNHFNEVIKCLKKYPKGLKTILKSICVAALEDMGVRPLHHRGVKSIRDVSKKLEFVDIFKSISSKDKDFHTNTEFINDDLCKDINILFKKLSDVDFYHIDHEFFGLIYQKFINNGNASHYTNTKLSKEMANYIANKSEKSQRSVQTTRLNENEYILDPALGSGQLLRSLLPFHKVFFGNQKKGIYGWRELGKHLIGRDIDEDAIWVAKINLWLSTAVKGEPFIDLSNFKKLDVIKATVNRRAGESIKEAFEIGADIKIAGCVSNPPWDAFKNDSRRGITYNKEEVKKIKTSLSLDSRQLNRAQIFMKIIHVMGQEDGTMRFSVILPDSIFVDQNSGLRTSLKDSIDFYFSYPRNIDPVTGKKIFEHVDNTRKFGILFGRSNTIFSNIYCYPFGNEGGIALRNDLTSLGNLSVFPLFSHSLQEKIVRKWKSNVSRTVDWKEGEFHQSQWADRDGRQESASGRNVVVGGSSFCDQEGAMSIYPINSRNYWKKMSRINPSDKLLAKSARTIFSDYINNSKKLNSASYIDNGMGINITNTILYSLDTEPNDWLIYDSAIFSTFIEIYGTSQHINAFRLRDLMLPEPLESSDWLEANAELMEDLGFTLEEANTLFDLNKKWIEMSYSREDWLEAIGRRIASDEEIRDLLEEIEELEKSEFATEA